MVVKLLVLEGEIWLLPLHMLRDIVLLFHMVEV
jgi:hypothetical protein